ncbi:MAG: hypothetical protein HY900_15360 [Deltaproteobacteria bacterium]|nr:hypothetical protein [Deltaproteobacteria bacterium]
MSDLSPTPHNGLREMNPTQLWERTMDVEKRMMLQVKVEYAVPAEEIFNVLTGDNVEPRNEFIREDALGGGEPGYLVTRSTTVLSGARPFALRRPARPVPLNAGRLDTRSAVLAR